MSTISTPRAVHSPHHATNDTANDVTSKPQPAASLSPSAQQGEQRESSANPTSRRHAMELARSVDQAERTPRRTYAHVAAAALRPARTLEQSASALPSAREERPATYAEGALGSFMGCVSQGMRAGVKQESKEAVSLVVLDRPITVTSPTGRGEVTTSILVIDGPLPADDGERVHLVGHVQLAPGSQGKGKATAGCTAMSVRLLNVQMRPVEEHVPVTDATHTKIMDAFRPANERGELPWGQRRPPLGVRYIRHDLGADSHPDGYTYTALIPVGPMAPGPAGDPNRAKHFWVQRSGGIDGRTEYAGPIRIPSDPADANAGRGSDGGAERPTVPLNPGNGRSGLPPGYTTLALGEETQSPAPYPPRR